MLVLYCCDYYSFVVQFEIRKYNTSSFVFLSQDCSINGFLCVCVFFFRLKKSLFLRETETEQEWGRGEREGDTESEAGSRF